MQALVRSARQNRHKGCTDSSFRIDLTCETGPSDKAVFFHPYETEVNSIEQRMADNPSDRPSDN